MGPRYIGLYSSLPKVNRPAMTLYECFNECEFWLEWRIRGSIYAGHVSPMAGNDKRNEVEMMAHRGPSTMGHVIMDVSTGIS